MVIMWFKKSCGRYGTIKFHSSWIERMSDPGLKPTESIWIVPGTVED